MKRCQVLNAAVLAEWSRRRDGRTWYRIDLNVQRIGIGTPVSIGERIEYTVVTRSGNGRIEITCCIQVGDWGESSTGIRLRTNQLHASVFTERSGRCNRCIRDGINLDGCGVHTGTTSAIGKLIIYRVISCTCSKWVKCACCI